MGLIKRGQYYFGDSQAEILEELMRYSKLNAYPVHKSADVICKCGGRQFHLLLDESEGVALRKCNNCSYQHPIGDSKEFVENATPEECECPCGSSLFEITVGLSLYADSEDVRWFYIGCRCPKCGLTACYGDWKNEYTGYQGLLDRI